MNRVVVIGGTGNVGGVAVHKMAQMPEVFGDIRVAVRSDIKFDKVLDSILQKENSKVKPKFQLMDASKNIFLNSVLRNVRPSLVMNLGPPYWNLNIMEACLKFGVNYLDTACHEYPNKLGFTNREQLAMHDEFRKKGIMAQLQIGFDPGVTNVMVAYCFQERIFDEIDSVDILDCNAGKKNALWAPNFDPEINLRELILPIYAIHEGKWTKHGQLIDKDAIHFDFKYPQAGTAGTYMMYHEELESLHRSFPKIKRMRFWMTFSEEYLWYLRVLHNLGFTSIEPVDFQGRQIQPIQFLKSLLPKGEDFNSSYKGKTCIGCIIKGRKNGKESIKYVYQVCDHEKAFTETNGNAIGYTTAVPAVTAAELILNGTWPHEPGVHVPESRPAKPFLVALAKNGLPWTMKNLREMPEFLTRDFRGKRAV
jgi:saccharopine dehydrogenase (NAD+, L-lysine forming)